MTEIDLVEEELWDHYSGLPNPLRHQYKKNLKNEESDTDDSSDIRDDDTKI